MVNIRASKTSLPGRETPRTVEAVRAEALFASTLQPSGSACPDEVRGAAATTLRRLGVRGCAAQIADEFGDHPDTAVTRMRCAMATIRSVYPAPSMTPLRTCGRLHSRADRDARQQLFDLDAGEAKT
jgi:hypothetical protein